MPPVRPRRSRRRGAIAIGRRVMHAAASDRISLTAAGCAFYAMLALFPGIFLLVLVYGLAFDSAIALAEYLHTEPTMQAAFERYQAERRVEVLRLQSAARNSLEWFEEVERYLDMPPTQFAYR